jgi:hypothetical protein
VTSVRTDIAPRASGKASPPWLRSAPGGLGEGRAWRLSWLSFWLSISVLSSLIAYRLDWVPHQSGSIYDISSGFSPYLRSLLERGEFVDLETVAGARRTTMRLPMVPLLHLLISYVVGPGVLLHVLVKNLIVYGLAAQAIRGFARRAALPARAPFAIFGLVFLNPVGFRTLPLIGGEESYYVPLLVVLFATLSAPAETWRASTLHGVGAVLAVLCLTKSTLTVLALSLLAFVAVCSWRARRAARDELPRVRGTAPSASSLSRSTAPGFASSLVPAAYVLAALAGWSVWSYQTTQRFTHVLNISSYDGINFYKGNNEHVEGLYPDVHLDVLDVVGITAAPPHLRADEWAVSDYFRQRASAYLTRDPWHTLHFVGFKAGAPFVFANSPARIYAAANTTRSALPALAEQSKRQTPKSRVIASALWLYKMSWLATVAWALRDLWRRRCLQQSALYLVLSGAIAAPFVVGFAYVNHLCALYTLMFLHASGAFFARPRVPTTSQEDSVEAPHLGLTG